MSFSTLITTKELANELGNEEWAIIDCRFSLDDTSRGRKDYDLSHIPGAVYAHLDEDLSGPIIPGNTGRHPLPSPDLFALTLGGWGVGPGIQVVVYDDWGGAIAARLWWMLRWLGHDAVAVLDGGWPLWMKEGRPTQSGVEFRSQREFEPKTKPELLVGVDQVAILSADSENRLFDSRAADRFRGENETIDRIGGHIPGAVSAPYSDNLGKDGFFLSPEELRTRFESLLKDTPSKEAVFYCGSGVSAAHNLLAMAHAGFEDSLLYIGSWSEWIADLSRPIETGG
jgi:thiosulfate/3-mercaptopyruvate sulfurtransferase